MIVCCGCSYTRYKYPCWPAYVQWFEKEEIKNLGASGSANETVMRTLYNSVNKYGNKISKAYVMWTGTHRYEIVQDEIDPEAKKDELVTYSRWNDDFQWNQFHGGHYYSDKHDFYVRHIQNERQNEARLLERILFAQMFLEKYNIDYKMMVYRKNILCHDKDKMTHGHKALYNDVDWSKFIFWKQFGGLDEFANDQHPEQFNRPYDLHPLPLAHYHWVKDVMYESKTECPKDEYANMANYKKTSVFHDEDNARMRENERS